MRYWPGRIREADGSRTHLDRVAAGCRAIWLQPRVIQRPRQESSLVFDLRGVACKSPTLRGRVFVQRPAEELNPVLQFRRLPCCPAHSQGFAIKYAIKYPDQESNLDLELRRLRCDPLHHRDTNQGADDWICTSIERFTGPLPFC